MEEPTTNRFKIWILIFAPFFSLILPYLVSWFDKNSKCNIFPVINVTDTFLGFLTIIYFGFPFIAGFYGFYLVSLHSANQIHDTDNAIQAETKPKLIYGLMILNFFSPFLLIAWLILFRFSTTCYQLKLNVIF